MSNWHTNERSNWSVLKTELKKGSKIIPYFNNKIYEITSVVEHKCDNLLHMCF